MKKPRLRDVQGFAQHHTVTNLWSQDANGLWFTVLSTPTPFQLHLLAVGVESSTLLNFPLMVYPASSPSAKIPLLCWQSKVSLAGSCLEVGTPQLLISKALSLALQ